MTTPPNLGRSAFRAWAITYGIDDVGLGSTPFWCPIANFVASQIPGTVVCATTATICAYDEAAVMNPGIAHRPVWETPTPAWATDFITDIDDRYNGKPVSGPDAIAALDRLETVFAFDGLDSRDV